MEYFTAFHTQFNMNIIYSEQSVEFWNVYIFPICSVLFHNSYIKCMFLHLHQNVVKRSSKLVLLVWFTYIYRISLNMEMLYSTQS